MKYLSERLWSTWTQRSFGGLIIIFNNQPPQQRQDSTKAAGHISDLLNLNLLSRNQIKPDHNIQQTQEAKDTNNKGGQASLSHGPVVGSSLAIPMERVDIIPYRCLLCTFPWGGVKGTAAKEAAQFAINNVIIYSAKTTTNTNHLRNLVKRRETKRLRRLMTTKIKIPLSQLRGRTTRQKTRMRRKECLAKKSRTRNRACLTTPGSTRIIKVTEGEFRWQ